MYKIENLDNVQPIVNSNDIILFEKADEAKVGNNYVQPYNVNLFNNTWFIFDFLIYASKCVKDFRINFFDQQNNRVTDKYVTNNFVFKANYIENICSSNRINFAITLFLDQKSFTATKFWNRSQILFATTLDERGVNLTSIIDQLTNYYLFYIQSEHLYAIIDSYNNQKVNNKIILSSGWLLIKYMLSLNENQYDEFYAKNIKWIESNFPFVNKDRNYWNTLLNKIEADIKNL